MITEVSRGELANMITSVVREIMVPAAKDEVRVVVGDTLHPMVVREVDQRVRLMLKTKPWRTVRVWRYIVRFSWERQP